MIFYKKRDELVRQAEHVSRFDAESDKREAMYGLPKNVAFCTRCVISNQRPNSTVEFEHTRNSNKTTIVLDDKGVCDACRTAAIGRDNVTGLQFHPERSGPHGLKILKRFITH